MYSSVLANHNLWNIVTCSKFKGKWRHRAVARQALSRVSQNSSRPSAASSSQTGAKFAGSVRCEYCISASQRRRKTTGGVWPEASHVNPGCTGPVTSFGQTRERTGVPWDPDGAWRHGSRARGTGQRVWGWLLKGPARVRARRG